MVAEAMRSAARRAASSESWPERVTVPSLTETLRLEDLRSCSENILALISVAMESLVTELLAGLLQEKEKASARREVRYRERCMGPP